MVSEDRRPPPAQRLGQGPQLGPGLRCGAPGDRLVEPLSGLIDVVGEVYVSDHLLSAVGSGDRVVGVPGVEGGVEPRPAGLVDAFGADEEELADVVEQVTLPPAVLEGGLLHALTGAGHCLVRCCVSVDYLARPVEVFARWDRTGARCQLLGWSVSPARPPNRTCDFHRIRLSTSPCRSATRLRS